MEDLGQHLIIFLLIFTRWLSIIVFSPMFMGNILPSLIKISLSAILSMITFFIFYKENILNIELDTFKIFILFIKEAFLGFIIGFLVSQIFFLYEWAGQFMDFARGASIQSQLVPQMGSPTSILGGLLFHLAIVLFFSLGLYRMAIEGILQSFIDFKIFSFFLTEEFFSSLIPKIIYSFKNLFKASFSLAMPLIAVSLIIDIGFSLINRLVPSFNAFFMSMPLKVITGIFILFISISFLMKEIFYYNKIFSLWPLN